MAVDKKLAEIPRPLLENCIPAQELPDKSLTNREIAKLWGKDRESLADCLVRQAALADAVSELYKK